MAISSQQGWDWQRIPVGSRGTEGGALRGRRDRGRRREYQPVRCRRLLSSAAVQGARLEQKGLGFRVYGAGGAAGAEGGAAGGDAGGEGGALRGRPPCGAALLLLPHAGAGPRPSTCTRRLAASHRRSSLLCSALPGPEKHLSKLCRRHHVHSANLHACLGKGLVVFLAFIDVCPAPRWPCSHGRAVSEVCSAGFATTWHLKCGCSAIRAQTEWSTSMKLARGYIAQGLRLCLKCLEGNSCTSFEIANPLSSESMLYQSDALNRIAEGSTSGLCPTT